MTGQTEIVWLVFSASSTKYGPGALAGTYVGGSAEATIGVGLGNTNGETAAAIGLAARINEDLVLKGTIGVSGGTTAVGVGIGYTFK